MKKFKSILSLSLLLISGLCQAENISKDDVLAAVEKSPAAVGIHDKQSWLNLFALQSKIEDPVGTAPHIIDCDNLETCDRSNHSAFWETFIAQNTIVFDVKEDIIAGNEIVRDLIINTELSTGVKLAVPTYLKYEVVNENETLKVKHLAAHWEVRSMIGQVMKQKNGIKTGINLSWLMLKEQGLGGSLGYSNGLLRGVFQNGKDKANELANAINNNKTSLNEIFYSPESTIEFPAINKILTVTEFSKQQADYSLQLEELRSAGYFTSGRFTLKHKEQEHSGVVFFEFEPKNKLIKAARFFWNE